MIRTDYCAFVGIDDPASLESSPSMFSGRMWLQNGSLGPSSSCLRQRLRPLRILGLCHFRPSERVSKRAIRAALRTRKACHRAFIYMGSAHTPGGFQDRLAYRSDVKPASMCRGLFRGWYGGWHHIRVRLGEGGKPLQWSISLTNRPVSCFVPYQPLKSLVRMETSQDNEVRLAPAAVGTKCLKH